MNLKEYIFKERLSQGYIIECDRMEGLTAIRDVMGMLDISTTANPDYHEYILETFLLADAHAIRREQSMHGADGAKKIFVVSFDAIISEAQNALLKTLEEPTGNTHFFFLVRTSEILLPTVRSRMQLIRPIRDASEELPLAKKFLSSKTSDRMKLIEPMTKAKADDKSKARENARVLVSALEPILHEKLSSGDMRYARSLNDIITAKRELTGRAPSVKLILEHLALTLPHIS